MPDGDVPIVDGTGVHLPQIEGQATPTVTNEIPEGPLSMKDKILKRAELSRITRLLKSRLEIAQHKVSRSWQSLPFKTAENNHKTETSPVRIRKRDSSDLDDLETDITQIPSSPPHHDAFLVPSLPSRHSDSTTHRYYHASHPANPMQIAPSTTSKFSAASNNTSTRPKISPLKRRRSDSLDRDSVELGSSPLKYRSSTPNPRQNDIRQSGHMTPPPSTPPPMHSRLPSRQSFKQDTEEGADLLLYLATSPSPAKPRKINRSLEFSSPPPMRGSSAVNTPIGTGFNLSEFLNFTPSPAQAQQAHRMRFDTMQKFSPTRLTYDNRINGRTQIDADILR